MPKPKYLYAIASGSYSDYRVHAVCESKADAEQVAKVGNRSGGAFFDDFEVEEMPYFPKGEVPQRGGWWSAEAVVQDDGRIEHDEPRFHVRWPWDYDYEPKSQTKVLSTYRGLYVTAQSHSRESAVKRVGDRAALEARKLVEEHG
jgi:hypothetical protein